MSVFVPYKNRHPVLIGIYKITSPSGKVYIGQSWDIVERWRAYKSSYPLRSQPKLAASLSKYGAAAHKFEILYWFSAGCTQDDLDGSEILLMQKHKDGGIELLNIRGGGRGGRIDPESSKKMVETRRKNGSYVISEATREKYRQVQKGRKGFPHSEQTKRKLSEMRKGRKPSAEALEKNRQAQIGRKHSPETKAKIAAAHLGRKRPDLAERNRQRARAHLLTNPDQRGLF